MESLLKVTAGKWNMQSEEGQKAQEAGDGQRRIAGGFAKHPFKRLRMGGLAPLPFLTRKQVFRVSKLVSVFQPSRQQPRGRLATC